MKHFHGKPFATHEVQFLVSSDPRSQSVTYQWIDHSASRRAHELARMRAFEPLMIDDSPDRERTRTMRSFNVIMLGLAAMIIVTAGVQSAGAVPVNFTDRTAREAASLSMDDAGACSFTLATVMEDPNNFYQEPISMICNGPH